MNKFNVRDEGEGLELPAASLAYSRSNEDEYIVDLDEDRSNNDDDDDDDEFSSSENGNGGFHSLSSPSKMKRPLPTTSTTKSFEHRASVRRQNCFFGVSVISLTMAFIAAYLFMGLSFTPANIGIFGDESTRKGGSGK
jgi:hypothetical protein